MYLGVGFVEDGVRRLHNISVQKQKPTVFHGKVNATWNVFFVQVNCCGVSVRCSLGFRVVCVHIPSVNQRFTVGINGELQSEYWSVSTEMSRIRFTRFGTLGLFQYTA